jgi:alkanesulfonate monooxygenase SsuD/methylene tetrahydromethanopterin reductase-like flavin-dependent oxidoreductase (luciferase family)
MQYAADLAPIGEMADPHVLVRLAVAAEQAGWDGVSTWDVLGTAMDAAAADPFVALAAIASATRRLRLITSVVVLPRRRPQLVAQAAATLDVLSGGRLVLGIGAGGDAADFTAFGEPFDSAPRAARLDEDAARIDRWLRGEGEPAVGPRPVQTPRPPIWIGGGRPGALRRAARWDGWVGVATGDDYATMLLSPEDVADRVAAIGAERSRLGRDRTPFDVALFARSEPGDEAMVAEYGAAGVTWWLESLSPARGPVDALLARIEAGPPRG